LNRVAIAIDGPAASGKSTVAGELAKRLNYVYLDTGVMYRAVTWAALQRDIPINDEEAVTEVARALQIEVEPPTSGDGRLYTVKAESQDITWAIRTPAVNRHVSRVASYKGVRQALTEQQRRIGQQGGVIMAGRDIGTVVLPDAPVKIYLDATPEERARRRHEEMLERGESATYDEVLAEIRERDRLDSTRDVSPLRPADDAVVIDSTTMAIEEVVDTIQEIVIQQLEACRE
jgi:cytidylate kinase